MNRWPLHLYPPNNPRIAEVGTLWIILIFFNLTPLFAATISFQEGVSPDGSYVGTEDTFISASSPSSNFNGDTRIRMDGSPDISGLIKWDVSVIPANAIITGAMITVNVSGTTAEAYEIYEVKRPWTAAQATWNIYSTGNSWEISGASGASDRGSTMLGTVTGVTSGFKTYILNAAGIALVQNWVNNNATNRGIIIQNYANTDSISLHSSATSNAADRPELTVTYDIFPPPPPSSTISFQNGVSPALSYMGTEDTYLSSSAPTSNFNADIQVRMDGSPDISGLIKWDLSSIPSNATVTGTTLTVNVNNSSSETYEIYEMKRPWVAAQTTWNVYATGSGWNIPGASGALDRGSTPLGVMTGSTGFKAYTLNAAGVALVQNWVSNPATNFGIIIQDYANSNGFAFLSSETGVPTDRPRLNVTYTVTEFSVSGRVYSDANRNGVPDGAESGLAGVTVQLFAMPTNILTATAVTATDGTYLLTPINNGSYEIRQVNPVNHISTTPDTLPVTISGANISNQNFGDFAGVKITGVVFADTGVGGGIPNNGTQDGTEAGIVGVSVSVTDSTGTTIYDATTTGFGGVYTLWVPTSVSLSVVVRETNPTGFISITSDTISLNIAPGGNLPNNNFADVPPLLFVPNSSQTAPPGGVVTYAHTLTAGTFGQVTLTATSSQNLTWTFYKDMNNNGLLDTGEPKLTPADLNLTANQTVQILARGFISSTLLMGIVDATTLTATQALTNSALTDVRTVTDLTTIIDNLLLTKAGSVVMAKPGDTFIYTLTYKNISAAPLTDIVLYDPLSEYLLFVSAVPSLDPGFPDATGLLRWTIPGMLDIGSEGSISYTVQVK